MGRDLMFALGLMIGISGGGKSDPVPSAATNLNGARYGVANNPGLGRNISLQARSPRYFDVYTPVIASLYSQVNWGNHPVPFPDDFVAEFAGRVVSIVGYEFDIVRPRNVSAPCVPSSSDRPVPCARMSVPSYEQYNHHYSNQLLGRGTYVVRTGVPAAANATSHAHTAQAPPGYAFVTDSDEASAVPQGPSAQTLLMGNGAEARLTVKYFPEGYGALLESPVYTNINPMIIDTNARGCHGPAPGSKVPGRHGPVPPGSNVGPEEMYSGLLECPCTDAFPRVIATAATLETGACPAATLYTEPQKCFAAAASLGLHAKVNVTVDSSTQHPAGCYATAVSGGYEVGFNANTSSAQPCGGGGTGARRRVAMADPDTKSVACTECHVDVDFQLASRPSSLNIQGEWQIVASAPGGNYNRFLVTIVFDPGSKNYTMVCNGPACVGAATTLGTGPVSADGTTYRGLPGVSGGAISPDNNEVRWDNGFALSRWFPAQEPATDVAGSYMVFVYGTRRTERDIAGTVWKVVGSNANFTVVAPGMPWTGTVQGSVTGGNTFSAWAGIPGAISGDFNTVNFYTTGFTLRRIDPASIDGTVTLTLAGPSDVWFGAGFMDKVPTSTPGAGAAAVSAMDNTYAVICAGDGSIAEFKLGHHRAGTVLAPSLAVVSNTVAGGVRQVVVTRKATGVTADHYTFDSTASNLGMINAVGNTSYVSYHRAHASAKLYYVDAGAPTCVCDYRPPLGSTASQGTLGSNAFASNCNPAPLSEMLSDPHWANATVNPRYGSYTDNGGVNPTCEIAAYRGGVKCCAGGTLLTEGAENRSALVAEAEYDHYQVMYRYYYEDATALAAAGKPVTDTFLSIWWTEHDNGEHDVPPCYGDPCVDTITSNFTGSEMGGFVAGYDIELVHVEGHCHVGCLGMELYNTDDPANPRLLCGTKIDYGQNDDAQNEMGYILGNQPCIFGPGFEAPPVITATTKLMSIKRTNNTNPRLGDMGVWEIMAAYAKPAEG